MKKNSEFDFLNVLNPLVSLIMGLFFMALEARMIQNTTSSPAMKEAF